MKLLQSVAWLLASIAFCALVLTCNAEWRNSSEITYHFTTCNSAQGRGPTFSQCFSYYKSIGSPIDSDGVLNDSPMQQGYPGGQGFVFPRTGWYNITVAGAAGGRGLCNPEKGKGVVTSGRLYVEKGVNDSVLVMVGQQGKRPCDINPTHPLCLLDVSNTTSAAECYSKWVNQTTYLIRVYTGGGSGGGASMLWPPADSNDRYDTIKSFPYVVSAGGGGSSVKLNYTSFILPHNHTVEEYTILINGKYGTLAHTGISVGTSGYRPSGVIFPTAGAGGGYFHEGHVALPIDGKSISRPSSFASGGVDCADFHSQTNIPFKNVIGGFGGGGGGCSGGGGGGGYTGGSVLAARFTVPGEGGFSYRTSVVEDAMELPLNDGDGYVDIVPSDCGCAEQCVLDIAEMFDCTCVSPFSNLAPDGFDCYKKELLELTQESSTNITLSDYPNTPIIASLHILSTPVTLYSMDFTMTIQDLEDGTVAGKCALIWLSTNLTPVLVSNIASRSDDGIKYFAQIQTLNSQINLTRYQEFLQKGVPVSAVVTVSTTPCTVTRAAVNISTTQHEDEGSASNDVNIHKIISQPNISLIALALNLTPTTTDPILSSSPSIIPLAVFIPVVLVLLGTISLVVIVILVLRYRYYCRKYYHRSKDDLKSVQLPPLQAKGQSTPTYHVTSPGGEMFTPPIYNGEQNMCLLSADQNSKQDYYKLTPYYTHFLNCSPYEVPVQLQRITDVSDIQHNYDVLEYKGAENKADEGEQFFRSRNNSFTFRPKFGVIVPNVDFTKYNKNRTSEQDWEYDRAQLTYLRDIGEGQFGKVLLMRGKNIAGYKGTLPVAVKTLSSTDERDIKKFLEEIDLMKKFCHPNIVSLLGVNCHYSEGAPLMILEYMPYGDLLGFLQKHRPKAENEKSLVTRHHLNKFARDVANGLHFLEERKYVHCDVAARNCLVGSCLQVKLSDFGMARGVQQKDYYRIAGQAVLPVRWLAPESIVYGVFTSASDMWSYGVLLWEIATYGCLPLKESSPHEIVEMAQNGTITHVWPEGGSEQLCSVMQQCHKYKPEDRPSFSILLTLLPITKYNCKDHKFNNHSRAQSPSLHNQGEPEQVSHL